MHILGEIAGEVAAPVMLDAAGFREQLTHLISSEELKDLGTVLHSFGEDSGFTLVTCLAESHIAVHTWPELGRVTVDVYICDFARRDSAERAEAVFAGITEYFGGRAANVHRVDR